MFSLADVLYFFADEFARLSRWRFPFTRVFVRSRDGFSFWHSNNVSRQDCFRDAAI